MKIPRKILPHIASAIALVSILVLQNGVFDLLDAYKEISDYKEKADPIIRDYIKGKEYKPFNSSMDESFFILRNFTSPLRNQESRNFSLQIMVSMNVALVSLTWLMILKKPKPAAPDKSAFPWDSIDPPDLHSTKTSPQPIRIQKPDDK